MRVIGDVNNFSLLKPGSGLEFGSDKRRVVRLELNTQAPCQLLLQTGAKDMRFLANVDGRESLTFIANGPVTVWADCEGEVWYWSPEMELTSVEVADPVIFTKMATRQARNPEVERMGQLMLQNFNRMLGTVQRDVNLMRRENERLRAEAERAAAAEPEPELDLAEAEPAPEVEKPKGKKKEAADAGT